MTQRIGRSRALVLGLSLVALAAGAQQGETGRQGAGQAGAAVLWLMGGLAGIEELLEPGFSVEKIVATVGYFVPPPAGQAQMPQRAGNVAGARSTTSDPRNYLSAAQIDTLLPLMRELEGNPFPSPSKAKGMQQAVDSVLSKAQQKEWESYLASVQKQL